MLKKLKQKIEDIKNDEELKKDLDWKDEFHRKLKAVREGRRNDRRDGK